MHRIPADEQIRSAVIDLICAQLSQETSRYAARIAAYRDVMRKHEASLSGGGMPQAREHIALLLNEMAALLQCCSELERRIDRSDTAGQA